MGCGSSSNVDKNANTPSDINKKETSNKKADDDTIDGVGRLVKQDTFALEKNKSPITKSITSTTSPTVVIERSPVLETSPVINQV